MRYFCTVYQTLAKPDNAMSYFGISADDLDTYVRIFSNAPVVSDSWMLIGLTYADFAV